jgi:Zinc dependent phospholipase C
MRFRCALALLIVVALVSPQPSRAYSVLTHEAIIDSAWDSDIRPALLKRFPYATHYELREAHAYAYGGAIIQDMGYYPHGSKFFSDLTHYVRSGDFVEALLRNSTNLDEYAFAIGAMAHYVADSDGHRLGTNVAEPLLYPPLKRKYGNIVTYEDDPLAHLKTEYGFDVLEAAKERYAPDSYHDFIGFAVAQPLLERAFAETYGLDLRSLFGDEDRAIGSYRHDVSSIIPKATRIAWHLKKNEIRKDLPGITKKKFLYNLSRASYEKNWGHDYQPPTATEKFLAFIYVITPKIGPLRILSFRTPTPETEKLFEASFNATLGRYRSLLKELHRGSVNLPNVNIDVGEETARGQYRLYDKACAELLDRLAANGFHDASPELRSQLLRFYSGPAGPDDSRLKKKDREKLESELRQLKAATATASVQGAIVPRR